MRLTVPNSVISGLTGRDAPAAVEVVATRLAEGTGAATSGLLRLTVHTENQSGEREEFRVVRKDFRPLTSGPHRHGAKDPPWIPTGPRGTSPGGSSPASHRPSPG